MKTKRRGKKPEFTQNGLRIDGPQTRGIKDFHSMPGYLVRRTQQISTALFAEECAGYDLTAVQYAALVAIGLNPQIAATRVSRLISLDRSTLGNVLERIEAKGLVLRRTSPVDRRAKLLTLSPKGRKLLGDVEAAVQRIQERILEGLSSREQQLFLALLLRVTDSHRDLAL
jgi:DNA-binding MarR family transcriptional regulator